MVAPNPTVLLVDDDATTLRLTGRLLRNMSYDVVPCSNGPAALEAFDKCNPDIVVTDYDMPPGMNGGELAREIKKRNSDMPVMVVSGTTENVMELHGDKVDKFMKKPIDIQKLSSEIDHLVAQKHPDPVLPRPGSDAPGPLSEQVRQEKNQSRYGRPGRN